MLHYSSRFPQEGKEHSSPLRGQPKAGSFPEYRDLRWALILYKYISQYFFIERKYENWHDDSLPDKSPFSKELWFDE